MDRFNHYVVSGFLIAIAAATASLATYHYVSRSEQTPLEALVQHPTTITVTVNATRCYGVVAHETPDSFVGSPPRLWLCEQHEPWYDGTGTRLPPTPPLASMEAPVP